jgi:hypothetical protein
MMTIARISPDVVCVETALAPETSTRPFWQERPCPHWCCAAHEADDMPEDRRHLSEGFDITPALHEAAVSRSGEVYEPQLTAYLGRHDREREPHVILVLDDRPGILLTFAEAGQLTEGLRRLICEGLASLDTL